MAIAGDLQAQIALEANKLRSGDIPSLGFLANEWKQAKLLLKNHLMLAVKQEINTLFQNYGDIFEEISWSIGPTADGTPRWEMWGISVQLKDRYDFDDELGIGAHVGCNVENLLKHLKTSDCDCDYNNLCFYDLSEEDPPLSENEKDNLVAALETITLLYSKLNIFDWDLLFDLNILEISANSHFKFTNK